MPSVDSCVSNVFRDLNFSDTAVSTVTRTYALGITGTPVTTEFAGSAYAGFTVFGTAGIKPYSYSLVGIWPSGLSVNSSTGVVSGTAAASGSYTGLSVRVTDAYGKTADLPTFTLTVSSRGPYYAAGYFGQSYFGVYA